MGIYDREYYRDEGGGFLHGFASRGQVYKSLILANVVFPFVFASRLRLILAQPAALSIIWNGFVPYLFFGFYQEVVYRGMVQLELVRRWGAFVGILIANVLYTFGPLHWNYYSARSSLAVPMFAAIFANVLAPYDPLFTHPEIRLAPPSWQHPFGTDDIGRDVFSRIIYGARISLWVGLLAVGIGTVAGTIIGLICGYWEGRLDLILQRFMDALMAIPGLILALAIVSVLTPNTTNAMLAIAVVIIPGNSRIVRGAVLSAKQNPYVEAARALGCRHLRIIASHILPNVTAPILIIASIWPR